ncbi:hypothetical protein C0J52_06073 [Blattella germanica]|nr:hypothetical protein C0J52_06073 [Blattella germanica]
MNGLVVVRNMHLSPNMACQFPQSCRICAQKNRTLISVYGEEGLLRQLITKLEYCLQIIVLENDGLPTTICWKCLSKLEICFELMQERIKGENEFRKRMMVIDALPITMEKTEHTLTKDIVLVTKRSKVQHLSTNKQVYE